MGNDLIKQDGGALFLTGEVDAVLSRFEVFNDEGRQELNRLPTAAERVTLDRRAKDIRSRLRPMSDAMAEMDRARKEIAMWLAGYTHLQNANKGELVVAFMMHLQDRPVWAVLAGIEDVKRGRVKGLDPNWSPSSQVVWDAATEKLLPLTDEQYKLRQVLETAFVRRPALPEADRKEMGVRLAALGDHIRAPIEAERLAMKEGRRKLNVERRDDAIMREYRAAGIEPIRNGDGSLLSLSLARKLGRVKEWEQERG